MQSEREALEEIVQALESARSDPEETGIILDNISSRLPDGDAKNFFKELEKTLVVVNEIVKAQDDKRIDEALVVIKTAKEKLRSVAPAVVPTKIIKAYKDNLDDYVAIFDMIKGLDSLFR